MSGLIKTTAEWTLVALSLVLTLGIASHVQADVATSLTRAEALLEAGDFIEALETFSRAAGIEPRNRQARAGIRQAKNRIREQMGDVSADKVVDMLDRLERIEAGRVLALTAQIATLEDERESFSNRIVALERDLAGAQNTVAALSATPAVPTERALEVELRAQLAATRRDETAARQTIAMLTRQIEEVQSESAQALASAESRLRQVAAAADIATSERDVAVLRVQAATSESERLRDDNRQLAAKLADVPRPVASLDDTETEDLRRALRDVQAENRKLAAALVEGRDRIASPPAVVATGETTPTRPDGELAMALATVRHELGGLQKALSAANQDNGVLVDKIVDLQRDLLASRANDPERKLRTVARRVARQGVEIDRLEAALAAAQERSLVLLNGMKENDAFYPSATADSAQAAQAGVAALQQRLTGLADAIPSPVVAPPPSVAMRPADERAAAGLQTASDQLAEQARLFDHEVMTTFGLLHTLQGQFGTGEDGLSLSFDGLESMHRQASDQMDVLKRRLRALETRLGDAG